MPPDKQNRLRRIILEEIAQRRRPMWLWTCATLSLIVLFCVTYLVSLAPPANFPSHTIITIEERASLADIADYLKSKGVIRSPFWFRASVILLSGQGGVKAGDYYFKDEINVFGISKQLTKGNFGLSPVKITFPEGLTVRQMSVLLSNNLINFNSEEFVNKATSKEGYLFPDTYLFAPNSKPEEIISTMESNFKEKIKDMNTKVSAFGKSLNDVVIMASILEAEARTTETRRTIAGILWKRMNIGMPLQVDAPFQYSVGKNTFQLTTADLKRESPYNTYLHRGLPPGAIGNPGLDSLTAAVTPIKSLYFYYLSDIRGNMHYAVTHAEHVANKERYLK